MIDTKRVLIDDAINTVITALAKRATARQVRAHMRQRDVVAQRVKSAMLEAAAE